MSNRAITWAFQMELPTTPKFVLVVLADLADEANSCWPGQTYIAKTVGANVRTVRRALEVLELGGYIERQSRRRASGARSSDRYRLRLDRH